MMQMPPVGARAILRRSMMMLMLIHTHIRSLFIVNLTTTLAGLFREAPLTLSKAAPDKRTGPKD